MFVESKRSHTVREQAGVREDDVSTIGSGSLGRPSTSGASGYSLASPGLMTVERRLPQPVLLAQASKVGTIIRKVAEAIQVKGCPPVKVEKTTEKTTTTTQTQSAGDDGDQSGSKTTTTREKETYSISVGK